jgi:hypothetical protein
MKSIFNPWSWSSENENKMKKMKVKKKVIDMMFYWNLYIFLVQINRLIQIQH